MNFSFWKYTIMILLVLMFAAVIAINYVVTNSTRGQLYADVNAIPKNKVGLLLGTAKYQDRAKKLINPFYQNRIDAAVALYMAGKVDYIIVSGDNSSAYYDEPELMKRDLIARGVPAKHIFKDNAGFRTLDSVLRSKYIFGQDHITIISQSFHNERAVFIANHKNIKAVAFNAADGKSVWEPLLREKMARVKMAYDLVVNTQAQYYGEPVNIDP